MLDIFIAMLLGIACGIVTGLVPGVHVNMVSALLLSAAPVLLKITDAMPLSVFIISMAVVHTFLDTIPSIYLGAADVENVMAVLPGQRMLLDGKGYEAVKLTIMGSFGALLLVIGAAPMLVVLMSVLQPIVEPWIGWLLIVLVLWMISREKKKMMALFVFLLSGVFGLIVLHLGIEQVLFPMLSGLFGVSSLVLSLQENVKIPEQKISRTMNYDVRQLVKTTTGASVIGSLAGFFPGLGPAQAAALGTVFMKGGGKEFLVLVGGLGTANMVTSLVTLYTLDKARNGAIVVVRELLDAVNVVDFVIFLLVALTVGCVGVMLTLFFARRFAQWLGKVNYRMMCASVIVFIVALVLLIPGWKGIIVLAVATLLGMIAPLSNTTRSHAMGCLLLPVILWFVM
ncbi:MAG TPA: tripartite tricarboxylate transporter permease [Candidatus Nanoarchaeia archaeon]|nr:tripartite tricarboxylate transporter permease [Candidatus Nanoarchaeia archaeon]